MSNDEQVFQLESQNVEVEAFILAVYLKYGYDFREYSFVHIKRRLMYLLSLNNMTSISELQFKMLYSKTYFEESILPGFSVNVTEMFRDPNFFKTLREVIIPLLKDRPYIKIWHAGCSTGAEVYSMAIILKEAGIYDKTLLYATDFNEKVLMQAKNGVLPIEELKNYTKNYQLSGGEKSFSSYYSSNNNSIILLEDLLKNIVFASHNLVSDGVFGEMDLIMSRNVLIYFTKPLQDRVNRLFADSLKTNGFLCLGSKEMISESIKSEFEAISESERIYKKTAGSEQYEL